MIHFCTLHLRFLECQILTFVYLWISHIKKFGRKIAKIEATLLTQRLVPNDPALTRTEPLTAGLGTGKDLLFESITAGLGAGKDLLFESILGRCVSSNEKLKVKNGYYVKIWWGRHMYKWPCYNLIRNGFICHMVKLEVFITGQEKKIPQISSTLQFSDLCFTN